MTIDAVLDVLEISTGDPHALAEFHARAFAMQQRGQAPAIDVRADQRHIRFVAGPGGQLRSAAFRFATRQAFDAHLARLLRQEVRVERDGTDSYSVEDPEGRQMRFVAPAAAPADPPRAPVARLQHFAVRTPQAAALTDFYAGTLGFVVSDTVHDDSGALTAAFLRTDAEHHALAIFRAPERRFDHFSCEVPDWTALRDWADHMAGVGIDLAWGVGRHGPGNDTFFMVRDADGNMGEISCDLESCAPQREPGRWPHRPQTLNRWGVAIMRS